MNQGVKRKVTAVAVTTALTANLFSGIAMADGVDVFADQTENQTAIVEQETEGESLLTGAGGSSTETGSVETGENENKSKHHKMKKALKAAPGQSGTTVEGKSHRKKPAVSDKSSEGAVEQSGTSVKEKKSRMNQKAFVTDDGTKTAPKSKRPDKKERREKPRSTNISSTATTNNAAVEISDGLVE